MTANRLTYAFPLLLAVAVPLPAQPPASLPPLPAGAILDKPRQPAADSLQRALDEAQAACELEDAQFAYDLDARTNHIRLDKPQYTNAPWSQIRLRASALAGDGLAAGECSASNAPNQLFWLSLAATNGWLPAQVLLAKDYEYERPKDMKPNSFTDEELFNAELELILRQPKDMRRAAAAFWRGKAQAGLPKLKADAAHSDPRAMFALGLLHLSGDLVQSNAVLAAEMFHKAGELGLAPAQESWGSYCELHLRNDLEAAGWYYRAATQGLATAQQFLSDLHRKPSRWHFDRRFQPKATERARWTFERASQPIACFSTCRACNDMGELCLSGLGVERNDEEAVKWYHRAIDLGTSDGGAEYGLALCYFGGDGVPQDDVEGFKWLQKAKQKGHDVHPPWEAYEAADAAQRGDDHTAIKYWRKNAALGDAEAQCNLGIAFRDGKSVARDGGAAAQWFQKAAEQGEPTAQFCLGLMFDDGQGVPQDYGEAIRWYLKAANQGHAESQNNLGVKYARGQGVPQDYVEAYKWYNLAAAQGDSTSVGNRDHLAARLTPSQVAEAQRLSREFVPRKRAASLSPDFSSAGADAAPTATGTGFFITDDGYLISNYHTVKDAAQVRLLTRGGKILAKVVTADAADDLALLKAEGRFSPLPITTSRTVKMGSTVATVGFPNIGLQGFAPKLAKGEIAALSGAQDDARYFQISVPVQPGNSGGALVDERGSVVGVVTAKLNAAAALAASGALPENVNYAVKSSFLLGFLESVPDVAAKLNEPSTKERKFEDVVKSAERAAVLVLVY